jgi:DNA polymerase-3 subunit alpha
MSVDQSSGAPGQPASAPTFVHLHVHSQYSLLQGAIFTDALVSRVKELGMPAVALTDSNNLFGAMDFYKEAKGKGIQPILGCEIAYVPDGRSQISSAAGPGSQQLAGLKQNQLVLLSKNLQGYRNLCQIVTRAYTEAPPLGKGQSQIRAVVDRELLEKYGNDLVVLSGGLKGEIAYKILMGDEAGALDAIRWFSKRFGEDFYLELQDSGIPEQSQINQRLFEIGARQGIRCVATTDAHYLTPEDAEAHEILQCIEAGRNLDFDRPKSLVPPEFYLKPSPLMRERFAAFEGVCDETLNIAKKCDVQFKFKDEKGRAIYHLPNYRPAGVAKTDAFDLIEYFRSQARKGLEDHFASPGFEFKRQAEDWEEKKKVYWARLEEELSMIEKTGFAGYFLIVSDFIQWAKNEGIPVGPGRGSGAGSLVAYSLKITDIDPIEYNLLFERFINPERISMPDFDVDFCQDRRGEVIDYVTRKYGSENVTQIITFGKLQAKAVIKDVGRVLGFTFAESDAITKLVPDAPGTTLDEAIQAEARLRDKMEQEPRTSQVIAYARKLEGLYRNAGVHAAGVIITEEPVVNYCALFVGKDGAKVTQFDKDSAEAIGLVKFDFLGLKTLTVIDHAVKLVRAGAEPGSEDANFDLARMNYKDPKVFALISSGDTDGVFQVESSGMKDLCSRLQPGSVEDITAINALYRPGPLGSGMVDDFIDRKHGRKPIVYDLPQLEPILRETYGVIVYQEQVMRIARDLAGYSLGQADMLRRAMGKKKPEEMAQHRGLFIQGALKNGIPEEKSGAIFDLMAKFAEYGFNKSHAAAYALITYQTAYLKTYFPAEFMAALMTTEMDNTDKITKYIADARDHGIPVLPPDVNHSQKRFSVEKIQEDGKTVRGIRFGLEAIKGVGGIAVDAILEERQKSPFPNVLEFCRRVSTRRANKKVLESLTLAGAFDRIAEVNRATLHASIEKLIEVAGDEQAERERGQSSLFDAFTAEEVKLVTPLSAVFQNQPDWSRSRKLVMEKQVVGFYVSGHPMETWQKICEDWLGWSVEKIKQVAEERAAAAPKPAASNDGRESGFVPQHMRPKRPELRLGGLVAEIKEVTTKKGSRMAFVQFEDLTGRIEVIFFPEAYQNMAELLRRGQAEVEPLVLTGELEIGEEGPKLLAKSMEPAEEAHRTRVQQVIVRIAVPKTTPDQLRVLKNQLVRFRGKCPVRIVFEDPRFRTQLDLPSTTKVAATPEMVEAVNRIFGQPVVSLQ